MPVPDGEEGNLRPLRAQSAHDVRHRSLGKMVARLIENDKLRSADQGSGDR